MSYLFLLIIIGLFCINQTQQHPCLYSDSTKTQLLNLQHQLIQSQQSCLPCLPQCITCLSQSDLTCSNGNCQQKYYYNNITNSCDRCNNLCIVCNDLSTCQNCIDGYFINQYGQCQQCLQGVKICTGSAIIQCMPGYYYDSNAYICRKCIMTNCKICTTQTQCNLCNAGYIVSNDGLSCLACNVNNCQICINVDNCINCMIGYKLQNNQCIKYNCNTINKCKQCQNINNISTCTLCEQGYYLLDNLCHYGISILCQYSLISTNIMDKQWSILPNINHNNIYTISTDYGSCSTCNSRISKLADNTYTYCIPSQINKYKQLLIDYIVYNQYTICTIPYMTISQPNLNKLQILYNMTAAYYVNIQFIIVITNFSNSFNLLNYTDVNDIFDVSINLKNNYIGNTMEVYPLYCANIHSIGNYSSYIIKLNLEYKILTDYLSQNNYTINSTSQQLQLQKLNLTFTLNSQFSINTTTIPKLSKKQLYLTFNLCLTPNCLQCLSQKSCMKCKYPYYIQNYKCVLKCDVGYYINKITRTCLSNCQIGYYYDVLQAGIDNICVPCPIACVVCQNVTKCSGCANGYYLRNDGMCMKNCSDYQLSEYYADTEKRLCKKCENPCKTCSNSANNCTSCLIGYQYTNTTNINTSTIILGTCVLQCPISYYPLTIIQQNNQTNPKCLSCNISCLSCQLNSNTCTSCILGFYLIQNKCVVNCPIGYIGSNQNIQYGQSPYCKLCSNPCSKCVGSDGNCSSCQFGLYLIVVNDNIGKCVISCPSQLYYPNIIDNNKICTKCTDPNCKICILQSSPTSSNITQICTQCFTPYFLQHQKCITSCTNSWSISGICQQCPYPCHTCNGTDISNYTCTSCTDGYFINYNNSNNTNGSCVMVCPFGKYGNYSNYQCNICPMNCITCMLQINTIIVKCLSCNTTYILSNYSCIPQSSPCMSSTYLPINSSICQTCRQSCLQCNITQYHCTKCKQNKYLLVYSGQCMTNCISGYFADNNKMQCVKCNIRCSSCNALDNCNSCMIGYYLYYNYSNGKYGCFTDVQCNGLVNYYGSNNNNKCIPCITPCLDCISQYICLSCINNTYLYHNSCLTQCPISYYPVPIQNTCKQCPISCHTCTSQTSCNTCKPNYYYRQQSNQCMQQCKIGQFNNRQSMLCQKCRQPCATCINYQYCLTCVNIMQGLIIDYMLLDGECITICPDGYYMYINSINNSKQCIQCNMRCKTCISQQVCTYCNYGYYLSNTSCVSSNQCANKYYADVNSRKCVLCLPPCQMCTNKYKCISCIVDHYLQQQYCYMNCPIGTYASINIINNVTNSICVKCPSNCIRCSNQSQCLSCKSGTYLYTYNNSYTYCVNNCPQHTYLSLEISKCSICSNNCLNCSIKYNNCTSCTSDKTLQNSICLNNCTSNYYQVAIIVNENIKKRECRICNNSCVRCIDQRICLECDSAYLVRTNNIVAIDSISHNTSYCTLQCPIVTFKNSQNLTCQPCQQGCLQCISRQICITCSSDNGYILYNIKCILSPCPSYLYTIKSQNKCIQPSQCQKNNNNTIKYYIYRKQKQCYLKQYGCPHNLIYKNDRQCIDRCMDGQVVNFQRRCIKEQLNGIQFNIQAIHMDGYILVVFGFQGMNVDKKSIDLFGNVNVNQGILWKNYKYVSSQRLLQSTTQFIVVKPPIQKYTNILSLYLIPSQPILSPTDLTISIQMTQPYSTQIRLNDLPLQNYIATCTLSSYIAIVPKSPQSLQSNNSSLYKQHHPLSIILLTLTILLSIINIIKSHKIYLLIPIWDIIHYIYALAYIDTNWGIHMNQFVKTFAIGWGKFYVQLFNDNDNNHKEIVYGSGRLFQVIGDIGLDVNLISNMFIIVVTFLIYIVTKGIILLIRYIKKRQQKQQKKSILDNKQQQQQQQQQSNISVKQNNMINNKQINKNNTIIQQPIKYGRKVLKILYKLFISCCYLCIPNMFFFAIINLYYHSNIHVNTALQYVLSILILLIILTCFLYPLYQILINKNKQILDSGINKLKKNIIINLPLYILSRKLLFLLFIAVYPKDPAFSLVFAIISTVFIFILIAWFQPYYQSIRYRITLVYQFGLFLLFLFAFVYLCNQREMVQTGYTGFYMFLIVVVWMIAGSYPVYHLYVLMDVKNIVKKIINTHFRNQQQKQGQLQNNQKIQEQGGYCIEQNKFQKQKSSFESQSQNDKNKKIQSNYQPPKQQLSPNQILENSKQLKNTQQKIQKQKKIKVPKDKLMANQTDHQADQSSQQSTRHKMKLADYTVRLTKRQVTMVKTFKHYDVNVQQSGNDQQGFTEKQIHLSKMLEKQRNLQKIEKKQ